MNNRVAGSAAELHYLETFSAVCEEGGITAAARRMGCSQPAVSYHVKRLEEVLGVKLLERSARRIVLTPEGRRFGAFADDVLGELARVRSDCRAGRRLEPLRIGSASGFGRYVLMPAIHRLREGQGEEVKAVEVRLEYEAADLVLERLEAGEYEAAFVYKRKVSSGLVFQPVYQEELVLIGSPALSAAAASRGLDRIETLEELPFVTYEECDYVFGRWFEASFGAQPAHLTSRSHFTELEEVLDFVARGVGLSIVPRDSADRALAEGEFDIIRATSGKSCLNPVYRVMRSGSEARPLLVRLTRLLRGR